VVKTDKTQNENTCNSVDFGHPALVSLLLTAPLTNRCLWMEPSNQLNTQILGTGTTLSQVRRYSRGGYATPPQYIFVYLHQDMRL
jgi:hypothetical protein